MPSHLPPECLHLIVNHLAKNSELDCLATLLVVSKTVFQITLPYIYSNPFGLFEQNITGADAVVKFRQLICLLLTTSIPYGDYSDLLKAMYEIDEVNVNSNIPSRPLKIKYLEYLRHFDLTQELVTLTSPKSETLGTFSRLSQYMEQHGLKQEYRTALEEIPFNWAEMSVQSTDRFIVDHLNMVLRRELSWVLCRPILDQLQSVAIPVSGLDQYLDNVERFSSLQLIVFVLDEWLQRQDISFDDATEEVIEKSRLLREKGARSLSRMVDFVRLHTCRFRGLLEQVWCPTNVGAWSYMTHKCPEEYIARIATCLEPMLHPTELDNANWSHFLAHYHETDLEHVERIYLTDRSKAWYGPVLSDPNFLRRCRALRQLEAPLLDPQIFETTAEIHQGSIPLPPLEVVRIRHNWEPFSNEQLDNIAQTFGQTLKVLMIESMTWTAQQSALRLGYHWHLPVISELSIETRGELLNVDPTFLDRCPALRILSLSDGRPRSQVHEVATLQPASLPVLYILHLNGMPALSFHPNILHSTKELRFLSLEHWWDGEVGYISSLAELEEADQDTVSGPSFQAYPEEYGYKRIPRPRWTWDWYLPNLNDLVLIGEFAFGFQFRMLRGCPKIERLSLNIILKSEEQVERELTEADFTVDPSFQYPRLEKDLVQMQGLTNKRQDEWSLQDIEQALQVIPMESLDAIDRYCCSWSRWRPEQPFMYRHHGGNGPPPFVLPEGEEIYNQPSPPWNACMSWLLHYIHDPIKDHRAIIQRLDHPDPAVALKEEKMRRKSLIHSVLSQMENAPLSHQGVVAMLRRLLADDNDIDELFQHTALAEETRLRVPSLKVLNIHGYRIPEPVLKIMLGEVFRNVQKLQEMYCTGFTVMNWLKTTQRMPWLLRAESTRVLGAEPLPIETLPESLLTTKVRYFFNSRECSFAD
ncbi:hypothetical protein BG005_005173 [Podila minutissima]|nr:hypothetical protein BG005_005173 [Podila minutissima]